MSILVSALLLLLPMVVMVVRGGHGGHGFRGGCDYRGGGHIGGRGPRKCAHCGRTNHYVDFCWDLHGTPSRFVNQVASQGDSPSPFGPPVSLSSHFENDLIFIPRDEYAQFLTHKRASTSSTVTLAQSGTASHCLLSSTRDPWIIDFGANEHMTVSSTSLSDYRHDDTPHNVTLVNGSLSTVAISSHTHLSPNIELLSVLHVPSFPFNLLSIRKITKSLNYYVSFYPSLCIFQNLKMRRMIGMGYEVGGLYYLDLAPSFSSRQP
jgi:hypothetical protein